MIDDPPFPEAIASTRDMPGLLIFKTVGRAIDFVIHELPGAKQELEHWQLAQHLLHQASNQPHDECTLKLAEVAFRSALKKERWLA
jgi:hypothetical protein